MPEKTAQLIERSENTTVVKALPADFPERTSNWEIDQRASRLRSAVQQAGGVRHIARVSGVPAGTINHYIAGNEMKASTLVALARACQVSIGWLATGEDDHAAPAPPAAKEPVPAGSIDTYKLGVAIGIAAQALTPDRHDLPAEGTERLAAAIYAILDSDGEPVAVARQLAQIILSAPGREQNGV